MTIILKGTTPKLINKRMIFFTKVLNRAKTLLKGSEPEFRKFQKSSYSQSGEDIIIDYIFNLRKISKPTYLDLGAHHPFSLNNTYLFYRRGARGVNIDANPELIELFAVHRPEDVNINLGVGEKTGELDFYVISESLLSTFSQEEAMMQLDHGFAITSKILMRIKSVSDIIDDYFGGVYPELVSIDVEGIDEMIVSSMSFKESKPKVICLETVEYTPDGTGKKRIDLIQMVINLGFTVYADTNINTIFVENEFWFNYK
jgi:hypothetical protein